MGSGGSHSTLLMRGIPILRQDPSQFRYFSVRYKFSQNVRQDIDGKWKRREQKLEENKNQSDRRGPVYPVFDVFSSLTFFRNYYYFPGLGHVGLV